MSDKENSLKYQLQIAFSSDVVEQAIFPKHTYNLIKDVIKQTKAKSTRNTLEAISKIAGSEYEEKKIWKELKNNLKGY